MTFLGKPSQVSGSHVWDGGKFVAAIITGSGGSGTNQWQDGTNRLSTTASVSIAGNLGASYYANSAGDRVVFFVSGANAALSLIESGSRAVLPNTAISGNLQFIIPTNNGSPGQNATPAISWRTAHGTGDYIGQIWANDTYLPNTGVLFVANTISGTNDRLSLFDGGSSNGKFVFKTTKWFSIDKNFNTLEPNKADTFFEISGSINSRTSSTRGTALFRGDLHSSGNISTNVNAFFSGSAYVGTFNTSSARFEVVGVSGSLFSVDDQLSGSLFSVNNISGVPVLEVFSDNRIVGGTFGSNAFVVSGTSVGVGTATPSYKLEVVGDFAATTKSFVIKHPNKPGWLLRHGSLEGPENGIYIRGRAKANKYENKIFIEFPEYWKNLIDQETITVQLTSLKRGQDLFVAWVDINGMFVEGNVDEIEFFYLVNASRIDSTFSVEYEEK